MAIWFGFQCAHPFTSSRFVWLLQIGTGQKHWKFKSCIQCCQWRTRHQQVTRCWRYRYSTTRWEISIDICRFVLSHLCTNEKWTKERQTYRKCKVFDFFSHNLTKVWFFLWFWMMFLILDCRQANGCGRTKSTLRTVDNKSIELDSTHNFGIGKTEFPKFTWRHPKAITIVQTISNHWKTTKVSALNSK